MIDNHPGPVTREEVAQAHRQIREKLMDRFEHLDRGFRMVDGDKSGSLGQKEMLRVLMMFNLHKINAKVRRTHHGVWGGREGRAGSYGEVERWCCHWQRTDRGDR